MLFFRIFSLLCFGCFVTGCGFHPLHMPSQGSSQVAVPIKIATIQDRDGQILRNYLVDLLTPEGTPQCPKYILYVSLTDVVTNIGVNKDETARRKNATMTAFLTLKDAKTNTIIYRHTTKAINSFSIINENYFSDLTAEDYAKKEALRLLAEKISILLVTFIDSHKDTPTKGESIPIDTNRFNAQEDWNLKPEDWSFHSDLDE